MEKEKTAHEIETEISLLVDSDVYGKFGDLMDQYATEVKREMFTKEEWSDLLDAVAYHQGCKKCRKEIKGFDKRNYDLMQKVAGYQDDAEKLQELSKIKEKGK